ncbi:MAG: hypothetical protein AAF138_02520 [Planctomycetota bacterium]
MTLLSAPAFSSASNPAPLSEAFRSETRDLNPRDAHALLEAPPGSGPAAFLCELLARSGAARTDRFVREAEALGFRVETLRSGDLLATRGNGAGATFAAPVRSPHGDARFRVRDASIWGAGAADGPGALAAFLYGARSGGRVIALAGASAEAAFEAAFVHDEAPGLVVVAQPGGCEVLTDAAPGRLIAELSVERPHGDHSPEDEALGWWRRVTARADRLNAEHAAEQAVEESSDQDTDRLRVRAVGMRSACDARVRTARLTLESTLPAWITPSEWASQLSPIAPDRSLLSRSGHAAAAHTHDDTLALARRAFGETPSRRSAPQAGLLNEAIAAFGGRAVGFGPGEPSVVGAHNEHVSIGDLERTAERAARLAAEERDRR